MRTIILFVLFFCWFNSFAHCQTSQLSMTLEGCLALPCEITAGDISAMTTQALLLNYSKITEERNQCTSILRSAAQKSAPAFKKLVCLKTEQRVLSCAVATSPEDKLTEFIQAGVSPAAVTIDLLVDLHVGKNKAVVCSPLSALRKHYTTWVEAEFNACINGEGGCEPLCGGLSRPLRTEWAISPSDVNDFEWPKTGLKVHSMSDGNSSSGLLMCSGIGKSFSLPSP